MAIALIFPALMLLTLAGVSMLGLDKPPVEYTIVPEFAATEIEEYQLAA